MRVLAVDVGTSSCKAGVFTPEGLAASASREYQILSPQPGQAELDPVDIWNKVKASIKEAVVKAGPGDPIAGVSCSSMGEVMVPVTLDRKIVGPSLLAYDLRGGEYAKKLSDAFSEAEFYSINTNIVGPYFSLPKLMWIKENLPDVYRRTDKFLNYSDFVAFMLGGDPRACSSLANRTMLLDMKKCDWSDTLLDWAGFARDKLGIIAPGGTVSGTVLPEIAAELGLSPETVIVVGGHDQCCNALGCGCITDGSCVVGMGTYETFCPVFAWPNDSATFLAEGMNIENHVLPDLYVSFLHNHSGLLVSWFKNTFAPNDVAPNGKSVYSLLDSEMPADPTRLLFLPYNEPPQWPRYIDGAAGVFAGMTIHTTRGEMFKSLLEGIGFFFVDALNALKRVSVTPEVFLASGGGSKSDAWMQIRADILGVPFTRLVGGEGSLNGAAMLAAVQSGMFKGYPEAVSAYLRTGDTFTPDAGRHAVYKERFEQYKKLWPTMQPILTNLREGAL